MKKQENVRKIAVYVNMPGLGDMLFITPLFRALKKGFPGAEVVFIGRMGRTYVAPLLEHNPYIDRLLEYDYYHPRTFRSRLGFMLGMRRERFDLVVDTQRKFLPSLVLRLGGGRCRVGYSTGGIFSHFQVKSGDRKNRHTADVTLDLARALGLEVSTELEAPAPAESEEAAKRFMAENGLEGARLVAGLVPTAGMADKRWGAEKFGELAGRLRSDGCEIVCFASKDEEEMFAAIEAGAGGKASRWCFEGGNVLDTAAVMRRCRLVVGNDSGPLHLADAAGAACVGIYGPTLPSRFGLLGKNVREVCTFEDCSPCGVEVCEHRRCLENITVDAVHEAARELLERLSG
ncbi:MAG: glycosyltransferase family 9 protein [bacterium]